MTDYIITDIYETKAGIHCVFAHTDNVENDEEKITLLFRISEFYDAHVTKGDVISDERFEELYEASCVAVAVAKAEKMLSTGDYSKSRLISRLTHYDIQKCHAEHAADIMVERGYINEDEQTKRIARYFCLKKHWGKKRIAAELMARGYNRQSIYASLDYVTPEEYSFAINRIVSQRFPTPAEDQKELERRIAALSRMGFSLSEIKEALK